MQRKCVNDNRFLGSCKSAPVQAALLGFLDTFSDDHSPNIDLMNIAAKDFPLRPFGMNATSEDVFPTGRRRGEADVSQRLPSDPES